MKARWATVLSVAGVLTAGSAAALVNTQVLQTETSALGADTTEAAPAVTLPAQTASTPAPAALVEDVAKPTSTKKHRTSTTVGAVDTAPQEYVIGDSGSVTLKIEDGVLGVVGTLPAPGWSAVSAESVSDAQVRVVMRSATVEVAFVADSSFGTIGTTVTSRAIGSATPATTSATAPVQPTTAPTTAPTTETTTAPTTPSTFTDDDENDDDSHEDEDHEDEDEHEDDDD